jgi:hypothetical protein
MITYTFDDGRSQIAHLLFSKDAPQLQMFHILVENGALQVILHIQEMKNGVLGQFRLALCNTALQANCNIGSGWR